MALSGPTWWPSGQQVASQACLRLTCKAHRTPSCSAAGAVCCICQYARLLPIHPPDAVPYRSERVEWIWLVTHLVRISISSGGAADGDVRDYLQGGHSRSGASMCARRATSASTASPTRSTPPTTSCATACARCGPASLPPPSTQPTQPPQKLWWTGTGPVLLETPLVCCLDHAEGTWESLVSSTLKPASSRESVQHLLLQ